MFLETLRRLDAVTQLSGSVPASVCAAVLAAPLAMHAADAEPELELSDAAFPAAQPDTSLAGTALGDEEGMHTSAMQEVDSAAQQTASEALAEPAAEAVGALQAGPLQQDSQPSDAAAGSSQERTGEDAEEHLASPGAQPSPEELADDADDSDPSEDCSEASELSDEDADAELEASPHSVQAGGAQQVPALADVAAYHRSAHLCNQQVSAP